MSSSSTTVELAERQSTPVGSDQPDVEMAIVDVSASFVVCVCYRLVRIISVRCCRTTRAIMKEKD